MRQSANPCSSTVQESTLVIGGCHGTCFLRVSDVEEGSAIRRQFLLAYCVVMTICMAVVVLALALTWIMSSPLSKDKVQLAQIAAGDDLLDKKGQNHV
ncbi:MAG: hypothetical protein AB7V46_23120 [Thermomicrobiales bacterium]